MLNAFRHLRSIHAPTRFHLDSRKRCAQRLSASQIHSRPASRYWPPVQACAQRLSASQIHSPLMWLDVIHAASMCSTPFGISDPFTSGSPQWRSYKNSVLNAFRHLRSIHGQELRNFRQRSIRAQRLSASQIHSPRVDVRIFDSGAVLNAFRHLRSIHRALTSSHLSLTRCSTPFGISDPFTVEGPLPISPVSRVLNAFRHLRSIHGRHPCPERLNYHVLNAFRHLRSIHRDQLRRQRDMMKCSTPFGISDPFTK